MMTSGGWKPNVTCKICRYRHPIELTCEQARNEAQALAIRTVPCEICGDPTAMLGTKRCDDCWELEHRIRRRPYIAARILVDVLKGGDTMKR